MVPGQFTSLCSINSKPDRQAAACTPCTRRTSLAGWGRAGAPKMLRDAREVAAGQARCGAPQAPCCPGLVPAHLLAGRGRLPLHDLGHRLLVDEPAWSGRQAVQPQAEGSCPQAEPPAASGRSHPGQGTCLQTLPARVPRPQTLTKKQPRRRQPALQRVRSGWEAAGTCPVACSPASPSLRPLSLALLARDHPLLIHRLHQLAHIIRHSLPRRGICTGKARRASWAEMGRQEGVAAKQMHSSLACQEGVRNQ